MQVPTRLSDVQLGETEVKNILAKLDEHGMRALGEHGDIDLATSHTILTTAL